MKKVEATTNPFITFGLGAELFAFDYSRIITTLDRKRVTKLQFHHQYLVGKINVNGYYLPVVDLRKKLNTIPTNVGSESGVLVLSIHNNGKQKDVGVVVDFFNDIIEFSTQNIYPSPEHGSLYKSGIVAGMAKFMKKYFVLLNIDNILTENDIDLFAELISSKNLEHAC